MPLTVLVTGSNKGIGLEIVKKLLFDGYHVIATARNPDAGEQLSATLEPRQSLTFIPLDIADPVSLAQAAEVLHSRAIHLDALINNAGVGWFQHDESIPKARQAQECLRVNYWGTLGACRAFIPFLKTGGRIINVSSAAGHLRLLPTRRLRDRFSDPSLTIPALDALANEYLQSVDQGSVVADGWATAPALDYPYGISKIHVNALTKILAREHPSLHVHSCHPGFCKTSMTHHTDAAPFTAEEGADTPVWLATDPDPAITAVRGGFWENRRLIPW